MLEQTKMERAHLTNQLSIQFQPRKTIRHQI